MNFPFAALVALLPALEQEASENDGAAAFPREGMAHLRHLGAFSAPLPRAWGGRGYGTEPAGALGLLRLLRLVGQGSLAVGRLLEGHVNAIRLVARYGTDAQMRRVAADVRDGALLGIWVTEGVEPVRFHDDGAAIVLHGEKLFASGALQVTRPLITARAANGDTRLILVPRDDAGSASLSVGDVSGMRGAGTGRCDFTGVVLTPDALVGQPGDYLRQPEFSAGAWRGIAVALGGIDRLVDLLRLQLADRARDGDPHQRVRVGLALIARETAALWARKAALVAEGRGFDPGDVAATVNLARIATERAGLDVIELVQRGLGLSAFVTSNVVERILRDLATYLRQPAPDETLVEAAGWFTRRDLPQPEGPA
ncbi:acyl-CoA dehydrogenase [Gluconacetobacter johannae DSM 13595]|uniref:Acyl-CoA dehydrogenase n=1 Tax=Gluconacetobacter johannae TaxID=112140 RepID=A0A7W4J7A4_9PROT|nr:acyl-CoA dehydrogenase family protein [Gluconacetobacter johannae]MBB2176045.1 acyl-CoA dehydrogenase [Gluconacetobacter johannae]GBQ79885.1 acyl-CoA dehydrogenase [Gluconacetobacter johannae DSM 13595]